MKQLANILMILAMAVAVVGFCDDSAVAQTTRYFCASDGNWSANANWNTNSDCSSGATGKPQNGDNAIILANKICTVDENTADLNLLDVNSGADVRVGDLFTLSIAGSAQESEIIGTITLLADDSVIEIKASHTFTGSGSIDGDHIDSLISIDSSLYTLTSEITIEGLLTINGNGTFKNDGVVEAGTGGDIWVNADIVSDTANAQWKVTDSGARLRIDQNGGSAPSLLGDFVVQAGLLDVDSPGFTTSGTLTFTGGTIDTASGLGGSATFTGS